MKTADFFLKRCSQLAIKAAEKGNSAVGAVLVKNDEIVSEGQEAVNSMNDITCHAEMEAIRLAAKNLETNNLSGYTLYSTHEPCIMCSYAIRFYRISKIVLPQRGGFSWRDFIFDAIAGNNQSTASLGRWARTYSI